MGGPQPGLCRPRRRSCQSWQAPLLLLQQLLLLLLQLLQLTKLLLAQLLELLLLLLLLAFLQHHLTPLRKRALLSQHGLDLHHLLLQLTLLCLEVRLDGPHGRDLSLPLCCKRLLLARITLLQLPLLLLL